MIKIRLWAALWAFTTLALSVLLFRSPGIDAALPATLAVAALCLIVITPFNATRRPARLRVFAGCVAYVVVTLAAFGLTIWQQAALPLIGLILVFMLFGVFLAAWAWLTRNRRRREGYFDRPE